MRSRASLIPSPRAPHEASARAALAAVLVVALGYYVSGRLGLLLAIPPGYATAVWPASGIALAAVLLRGYRVWPGIWLGSFAINAATAFDFSGTEAAIRTILLPSVIAGGAALQACAGSALIRRWTGYHNLLLQERQVFPMLMLGGPVSCVLNATAGVGSLYLLGRIPADNVLFNWWTWWVGDSIGVLIFAPLVLVWAIRPSAEWRRRQLLVTIPMAAMFACVVGLFVSASTREQARMRTAFDGWAREFTRQLQHDLDRSLDALNAVEGLFAASSQVGREEFEAFALHVQRRQPTLRALSWNAFVPDSSRAAFEAAQRAEGLQDFAIRERAPDGSLVPAARRPSYVAITYISPAGNDAVLGLDVTSEPRRHAALERARVTGQASATAPIELLQDHRRPGLLVILPINAGATATAHSVPPLGYAAGVFRADDLVGPAVSLLSDHGLQMRLSDVTGPGPPALLAGPAAPLDARDGLYYGEHIEFGGRTWLVELQLTSEQLVARRSWQAWTLLAAGMLFTGLLGMLLLVMVGRGASVERLVIERTAALSQANRELAGLAEHRRALELESRQRSDQLAASNAELEAFAYAVSHDLQAPLRSIASFVGILDRRFRAQLGTGAEFLDLIRASAGDMRRLIEDLLQLSRVTAQRAEMRPVQMGEAARVSLEQLRADIAEANATVEVRPLPAVFGDERLLTQLVQNLVGNAIKFRRAGVAPVVTVAAARQEDGLWRFSVTDNGIGIPLEQRGKLFQLFKRLHSAEEYPGTGLGLALCRKIVLMHGGRIWVESPAQGATFCFTLPGAPAA